MLLSLRYSGMLEFVITLINVTKLTILSHCSFYSDFIDLYCIYRWRIHSELN